MQMDPDDVLFLQLRDCFSGGYSMPQYCIDSDIKRPLIVAFEPLRLWEIYVQFRYDKRMLPEFCLVNSSGGKFNASLECILSDMSYSGNEIFNDLTRFDKVIMLTTRRLPPQIHGNLIYLDELLRRIVSYVYCERPLYEFLNRHAGVKVITTNYPVLKNNQHTTDYEHAILSNGSIHDLRSRLENRNGAVIPTRFDMLGYNNDEVHTLLTMTDVTTNLDGSTSLIDTDDPLLMIRGGIRKTAYQPDDYDQTIYFMGTCTYVGIGAPYDKTIESYLQQLLNSGGHRYRVENASQFYAGRYQDIFYSLEKLPVVSGDIVFVCLQDIMPYKFPFFNIRDVFDRPHNFGEVFSDVSHLNENGYRALANIFYALLVQNKFFADLKYDLPKIVDAPHMYGLTPPPHASDNFHGTATRSIISGELLRELDDYKQMLRAARSDIGSIVMNCNPFTRGHEYLIRHAAAQVDTLYVFVVEEDKSEFPFADRFELVKRGVEHIDNVKVIRSGKFIISQLTFEGYFNKAKLQDQTIDPSLDVEIFATEIAPTLGINVRFVGEEPFDKVTRDYNDTMRRLLPKYGIDFREIPRMSVGDQIVSASEVRRLLADKNFDAIEKLVPATTMVYLLKKFTSI